MDSPELRVAEASEFTSSRMRVTGSVPVGGDLYLPLQRRGRLRLPPDQVGAELAV